MPTTGSLNDSEAVQEAAGVPGARNTPPVINTNTYGGAFGGPIRKDKLFFFASYQEERPEKRSFRLRFFQQNLPPVPNVANRGAVETCTLTAGCTNPNAIAFVQRLGYTNLSPSEAVRTQAKRPLRLLTAAV